jgi:hypothetical protein
MENEPTVVDAAINIVLARVHLNRLILCRTRVGLRPFDWRNKTIGGVNGEGTDAARQYGKVNRYIPSIYV